MRHDKYPKKRDVRVIDDETSGVFFETMKRLGFDPSNYIDENNCWKVETIDTKTRGKYAPNAEISQMYSRVHFSNAVFKHAGEYGLSFLNGWINTMTGWYFIHDDIERMVEQYMFRFVPYDDGNIATIKQSFWKELLSGPRKVLYANRYNGYTKILVKKSVFKAFASKVIEDIQDWLDSKDDNNLTFREYVKNLAKMESNKPFDVDKIIDAPQPYSVICKRTHDNGITLTELHRIEQKPEDAIYATLDDSTRIWSSKCGMWDYTYPKEALWEQFPMNYQPWMM